MPSPVPLRRQLLVVCGALCVVLGAIGAVLPVLPTTPFLLLAAACFAKSSERCHRWLLGNRIFGPTIRTWERHRALPRGVKPRALIILWIVLGASMAFALDQTWHRVVLLVVGLGVSAFLLSLPVRDAEVEAAEAPSPPS